MMWPDVIPAGKIANQLSSAIDILPTVSHIVDGNLPKHKIDGINILEILKGEKVNPMEIKMIFLHDGRTQGIDLYISQMLTVRLSYIFMI